MEAGTPQAVKLEDLHLPAPVKYGKGKKISTAVDVLEGLAAAHEVPRMVLDYRQLTKLKSTYVDALPAMLNRTSGRLHTTFGQTGTATGRLSSANPNLQNIPIRTALGREIRAARRTRRRRRPASFGLPFIPDRRGLRRCQRRDHGDRGPAGRHHQACRPDPGA